MDVEWAHAIAPAAHILLVEADSAGLSDLLAAEQYAGTHANYVSNSWGFPEFAGETPMPPTSANPGSATSQPLPMQREERNTRRRLRTWLRSAAVTSPRRAPFRGPTGRRL